MITELLTIMGGAMLLDDVVNAKPTYSTNPKQRQELVEAAMKHATENRFVFTPRVLKKNDERGGGG